MGSNIHGTLGLGNSGSINYAFKPTLIKDLKDVDQVFSGSYHICALKQGELYTWGKGIDGQLGHANMKNVFVPTKVQALGTDVETVSCGMSHTLVTVSESVNNLNGYAFGNGIYGQLGCGSNRSYNHPINIKLPNIQSVSAGENHSLFISDGQLYGCGDNSTFQIGNFDDAYKNKKYIL
jgi:alpha-tubulin suppressor-like RCC1 family protein